MREKAILYRMAFFVYAACSTFSLMHWQVEEFFRTVKQQCHAQDFFVRNNPGYQKPYLLCAQSLSKTCLDEPR